MRVLPVIAAVGLSVLALAPPVGARLVPQQGMAGVELGLARAAVRDVLGEPLRIARGSNDFGPYTEFRYPFLVRVSFQGNGGVTAVGTTGRRERTATGIGVGSTARALRRALPRARCENGRDGHCYLGSFRAGERVTDFMLRDGRVTRVVIGFVID